MTQISPSILLYAQAVALLQQMQDQIDTGVVQTIDGIALQIKDTLSRFEATAGTPLLDFEPVVDGEPPLSAKINRTYASAQFDVNILQNQVDVLRATAVYTHNVLKSQILNATYQNDQVNNKMKTLQLFTGGVDSHTFVFGDNFINTQFVDASFTSPDQQAEVGKGFLLLGQLGLLVNLSADATVTILDTSNGFAGNNQEIQDPLGPLASPLTGTIAGATTGAPAYTFVAETDRRADPGSMLDGLANTWFEYEHYLVKPSDIASAGGFGFTYENTTPVVAGATIGAATDAITLYDWSTGPPGGVLQLDLQFDLGSVQSINTITYSPYGLDQNKNHPVEIISISTSADGNTWLPVVPTPVWVGTVTDLQTARAAANVTVGDAAWSFQVESAQFIRLSVHQPSSVACNIGHLAFRKITTNALSQGPIPPLSNPTSIYTPQTAFVNGFAESREFFLGQRWAIGVTDFVIQQLQYQPSSVYVTRPINVGGVVDRVAISADIYIPPSFDPTFNYVQFFISPDNGNNWYQISRIQDNFLGVPEILAFNDPLPVEFHEVGVAYFSVPTPVTSLRVKIQLTGGSSDSTSTPLVRSYQLNVRLV